MSTKLETNYLNHVFSQGMSGNERMPTLLYITKQQFGGQKRDRPLHSHDSLCEILLVYRGFGNYVTRSQTYPIQAGDILFYNQGEAHEVRSMSDQEIGTYCFGVSNLRLEGLPENHIIPSDGYPVRPAGALFDFLNELCERAYQILDTGTFGKAAAQCLTAALLLIAHKIEVEPRLTDSSEQDTRMSARIRDYLDQHFTEPLTLKTLADAFQCSEPYISHLFKKTTGYSPIQYVIRRRIGLAQTYLVSSDYTATQIATIVGYDNTNYFSTIFTKIVGVSPIRYKKQYLESLRGAATQ
ncbi:helix-turn-helix domain-containing protein [Agathobaculum sp.]|uniref:helix-turn-helix domain-containing protein n=1 Tax=Agathobaculum sp. TaxID=2048138 RepID=UPI002A814F24|nr:AraC family transcriptional regulator [Agathobaculum sp.]MDY3619126.1 AraC family transcriptional regulator [Agathobaculum sp.]